MYFKNEAKFPIPTKDIISWIFDEPKYDIDKPIYIDTANPSRSISFRQARTAVRQLAAGLRAAGLKQGDCACLHSFNDIYYPILVLGIIAAGGIFAGTNPSYTPHELAHHIKTSKTKFLITEPEMLPQILSAAETCSISRSNIWIFDVHYQSLPVGFKSWTSLLANGEADWYRFDSEFLSKTTTGARLFSSGTTGLPKAAELSHYNLIAQHTLVFECQPRPYEVSRILCLPMFHVAAVPSNHFSHLRAGEAGFVMRRFELEPFLAAFSKFNITDCLVVPPMVVATIMSPLNRKYSLKSIKQAISGAAPLDKGSQARLQALLEDGVPCTQVWGMTELSCIATMIPYPEKDTTGSVGRLIPNLEAKLIDDDGNNISAYNKEGELCIRGPTVIKGYFDNPTANALSFDREGFFKTGDIGYCDEKTKLWYIVDRKKELIKVRGFQVAPPEVEAVLLAHPHIVDAAVIGVQRSIHDSELPRAYVVRRPTPDGAALTEEIVKNYVAERLAKYKRLEGGVVFVDAIPKNPSGKILKRILREEAKKEMQGNSRI